MPAATEPGGLVVNGMSLSRRDSPFANSGIVVGVELGDVAGATAVADRGGVLGGVALQRHIERGRVRRRGRGPAGAGDPGDRLPRRRGSSTVPESSYLPGLAAGDIGEVLDAAGLPLAGRLRAGARARSARRCAATSPRRRC